MTRPAITLDPEREAAELRAYLGERYDHRRLQAYEAQLEAEFAAMGDEEAFYRASEGYLYDLTAFAMTGTKLPYLRDLTRLAAPGARLLDYGCGIGSDGLLLLEAGYHVEFADFDNPSTRYLRWRLARRGLEAPVHDLDRGAPPAPFDLAYAFDVVEHVPDPFALLAELERVAGVVLANFLEPQADDSPLHRSLPVRDLLAHATRRRLLHYRRYHGRSHLVAYRPEPARGLRALISRGRRLAGILSVGSAGRLASAQRSAAPKRFASGIRASRR